MYGAVAYWRYSRDELSAKEQEALMLEYHREVSGLSPILTGWNIKSDSYVGNARTRVEKLLDTRPGYAQVLRKATGRALKSGRH